jgi:hypothetical protein
MRNLVFLAGLRDIVIECVEGEGECTSVELTHMFQRKFYLFDLCARKTSSIFLLCPI